MNLACILQDAANASSERVAISDLDAPGGRLDLTYRVLWHSVQQIAGALAEAGIEAGDRVALLLPNSLEYVQSFFAAATVGAIVVPMNIRLLEGELLHVMNDSGARLLIADGSLLGKRMGLAGVAPLGEVIVRGTGELAEGQRPFDSLVAQPRGEPQDVAAESVAAIMYTSGTTGSPKGVMLSHGAWRAVGNYAKRLLHMGQDEVTISAAALTHGAGFLLLGTFAVGGRAVVCSKFDAVRTLALFTTERITSGFFVPSMIRMLIDANAKPSPVATSLRALYYAGSPIDQQTLREALRVFGSVLVQSFGQMEIPMFLTVMDRGDHQLIADGTAAHLACAAGRVAEGVRLRIMGNDGEDVRPGDTGEIAAQGPHMMSGYWNRPEATAQSIVGGWLRTGDIGRFDADGYLYVLDRKKDMIISGGSNVYAQEVEEVLRGIPNVRDVAVIGLPHPKWGEMVTAVLVSDSGEPVPDTELEQFCRAAIADFRRPKKFLWVDELPRNAYGKVLKRALRERYSVEH